MSDHWIYFPCSIGDSKGSIFYDHGIRDIIDSAAPSQLLKVSVTFKEPNPSGLPNKAEFGDLMSFEDVLGTLVQEQESLYVGRISVNGRPEPFALQFPSFRAFGSPDERPRAKDSTS